MQDSSPPPASDAPPVTSAPVARDARVDARVDASDTEPSLVPVSDERDSSITGDSSAAWSEERRTLPRLAALSRQTSASWLHAARAPYLVLSLAPVLVTAALLWARHAPLSPGLLVLTALAAVLAQAGAHLLDTSLDTVRAQHRAAGGGGALSTAQRRDPPFTMGMDPLVLLRIAVALLLVGACLGVPLALAGGVPVLLLGAAGLLVAFLYSATDYALKRLPLGELAVGLAFGPGLVTLTTLAQGQPVTPFALALGVGLGLVAAALVEAANLRAMAPGAHAESGEERRTLMRLLGPVRGGELYFATVAAAYVVIMIAAIWHGAPHGALAVLFSLPVAILPMTGALRARAAATLTLVVRGTLRTYLYFAFWLTIGLLLGALYLHLLKLAGA